MHSNTLEYNTIKNNEKLKKNTAPMEMEETCKRRGARENFSPFSPLDGPDFYVFSNIIHDQSVVFFNL